MATPIDREEVLYQLEGLRLEAMLNDECEEETIKRCISAVKLVPTLTPPNEPLTCDGCDMQGEKATPCASCIRDPRVCDYYTRRPPKEQEGNNDGD